MSGGNRVFLDQQLIKSLLKNVERRPNTSVHELAAKFGMSSTWVAKLLKKYGVRSFKEPKFVLELCTTHCREAKKYYRSQFLPCSDSFWFIFLVGRKVPVLLILNLPLAYSTMALSYFYTLLLDVLNWSYTVDKVPNFLERTVFEKARDRVSLFKYPVSHTCSDNAIAENMSCPFRFQVAKFAGLICCQNHPD